MTKPKSQWKIIFGPTLSQWWSSCARAWAEIRGGGGGETIGKVGDIISNVLPPPPIFFLCLFVREVGCVRGYPNPVSGKLTQKFWRRKKASDSPTSPLPSSLTDFRPGACDTSKRPHASKRQHVPYLSENLFRFLNHAIAMPKTCTRICYAYFFKVLTGGGGPGPPPTPYPRSVASLPRTRPQSAPPPRSLLNLFSRNAPGCRKSL